jgi:hypothetical protein
MSKTRTLAYSMGLMGLVAAVVAWQLGRSDGGVAAQPIVPGSLDATSRSASVPSPDRPISAVPASVAGSQADAAQARTQVERDAWRAFQKALSSGSLVEIYAGIRAAKECAGLDHSDLSTLVSDATAKIPPNAQNREIRIAAAKEAQQRCAGFSNQTDVGVGLQQLWGSLKDANSPEYVAQRLASEIARGDEQRRGDLKASACTTLAKAKANPDVLREMSTGLAILVKKPKWISKESALNVASAGVDLAICRMAHDCNAPTELMLLQCAMLGECGADVSKIAQGALSDQDWAYAQELSNSILSAADTGTCSGLF